MSSDSPSLHEDRLEAGTVTDGRLLVDLRAEGRAEELEAIVGCAISGQHEVAVEFLDRAAFQSGKPEPTHRVAALV